MEVGKSENNSVVILKFMSVQLIMVIDLMLEEHYYVILSFLRFEVSDNLCCGFPLFWELESGKGPI